MHRIAMLLLVCLCGCYEDQTISGFADPDTLWELRDLNGTAFTANATISFPEAGKVAGQAPCNQYTATQSVPYPWILIEDLAVTRRACPDLDAEAAFFEALQRMTVAEVSDEFVILGNDDGEQMIFTLPAGD